jgi:hypothetical protein
MDMETTTNETERPAVTQQHPTIAAEGDGSGRKAAIIIGIVVLVVLALIVGAVIWLAQPETPTERIRDIFIIVLAFVSLFVTVALAVLILQLARLLNLLQNEIKPILDSTNETMANLRGTTAFLSDNLVEPVIKMNEMTAAMNQVLRLLGLARRSGRD